jgi:type III pantothenate kinase
VKLLVDIGNSRVKWACAGNGPLSAPGAAVHRGTDPALLAEWLTALPAGIDSIRLASVARNEVTAAVTELLERRYGRPVEHVETAAAAGALRNGYRDWRQLGVDRWLALRAAHASSPDEAACIVDAGTAVTVDSLAPGGHHLGGLILPGMGLLEGLLDQAGTGLQAQNTGDPDGNVPPSAQCYWQTDTSSARRHGPPLALAALVERACMALARIATPAPVRLLLTGGDAERLAGWLGRSVELRPLLVLEGLALD